MNSHRALIKACFCVANLRNSLLLPAWTQVRGVSTDAEALRAIRRLESGFYEHNLLRPELIRSSLVLFQMKADGILMYSFFRKGDIRLAGTKKLSNYV